MFCNDILNWKKTFFLSNFDNHYSYYHLQLQIKAKYKQGTLVSLELFSDNVVFVYFSL